MIACSIPIVVASLLYQRDRPMSDLMFGIIATPGIVLLAIMTFFYWKAMIFTGLRSWLLYRLHNFYWGQLDPTNERGVLFSAHEERVRVSYQLFHTCQLEIPCSNLDQTLAIYPTRRWWDPFPETEFVDDYFFDVPNRFFLYSNQDSQQVAAILNSKVQQQLLTLDSLFLDGRLTVVMRRRRLFVEIKTKKMAFPQLRQLIFECCVLVRILRDGTATMVDSVSRKAKLPPPASKTEC